MQGISKLGRLYVYGIISSVNNEQTSWWDRENVEKNIWSSLQTESDNNFHWRNRFDIDKQIIEWKWGIKKVENLVFSFTWWNKLSKRRRDFSYWGNKFTPIIGLGREEKIQQTYLHRHAWKVITKTTSFKKLIVSGVYFIIQIDLAHRHKTLGLLSKLNYQYHQRSLHDTAQRYNNFLTLDC